MASIKPLAIQAKQRLKIAPNKPAIAKIELALNRSAIPVNAIKKVPRINPICKAFVSQPISATEIFHSRIKSKTTLFALNHKDVPNN